MKGTEQRCCFKTFWSCNVGDTSISIQTLLPLTDAKWTSNQLQNDDPSLTTKGWPTELVVPRYH